MAFLLLAVVFMGVGIAVVVVRNRRPGGTDASISDFEEHLDALTPRPDEPRGRRSG